MGYPDIRVTFKLFLPDRAEEEKAFSASLLHYSPFGDENGKGVRN
jgi:hypothetical protein